MYQQGFCKGMDHTVEGEFEGNHAAMGISGLQNTGTNSLHCRDLLSEVPAPFKASVPDGASDRDSERRAASSISEDVLNSESQDSDVVVGEFDSRLYPNELPDTLLQQTDLYLECNEDGSMDGLPSSFAPLHSLFGENVSLRISFPRCRSTKSVSSDREADFEGCETLGNGIATNVTEVAEFHGKPCPVGGGQIHNQREIPGEHTVQRVICTSATMVPNGCDLARVQSLQELAETVGNFCENQTEGKESGIVPRGKVKSSFVCAVCEKEWSSSGKLRRHLMSHNAHQHPCPESGCSKKFKHRPALLDHQRVVHRRDHQKVDEGGDAQETRSNKSASELKFLCSWPHCGRRFRDGHNLRVHYCLHTGDTLLSCSLCCYKCVQKSSLNWHIKKMHT